VVVVAVVEVEVGVETPVARRDERSFVLIERCELDYVFFKNTVEPYDQRR
jgi:hypothetical protein